MSDTDPARAALAKLWEAGAISHSLTTEGASLLFMNINGDYRVMLTDAESSLFYLCTDHGGVLAANDQRCQTCIGRALMAQAGVTRV